MEFLFFLKSFYKSTSKFLSLDSELLITRTAKSRRSGAKRNTDADEVLLLSELKNHVFLSGFEHLKCFHPFLIPAHRF